MASSKRKQDEKHLKMLREMAALPPNKQCLDCHQRGPTYVNMTIGSFVCTSCSGILRGLNPPHRVKSISMASFTPDEMEFLKCHGNEFCRKVYLGLYDSRSGVEPDSRDEQKVKDFMIQKYERKRYYVAPTETMKNEAKQANEAAMNKQPATRPLKKLLGEKTPSLIVNQNDQSPKQTLKSQAAAVPGQITLGQQPQKDASFQSPGQQSQSSQSSGSATMDLLGDLGGDPFSSASSTPSQPAAVGDQGGFADFASFNQFGSQSKPIQPPTQPSFPGFQTTSNPLLPLSNTPSGSALITNGSTAQPTSIPASTGGDRYSALSDLFSSSPSSTGAPPPAVSNVSWGGGSGTELSWGGGSSTAAAGGTGVNWNSQGVNWNSSGTTSSANQGLDWMSSGSTSNTTNSFPSTGNFFTNHVPVGKPGNPFFSDYGGTANPFGGSAPSTSQTGNTVSNPFGGGQTGFGQTQAPLSNQMQGFGQSSQPQPTVFGQPAGFGQPVSSSAGFGQPTNFGQPNMGGFGQPPSNTAGFGGQPAGWGGGQQQGFGQFPVQNGGFSSSAGFGGNTMTTPTGQFSDKMGGAGGVYGAQQGFPVGQQGGFPPGWGQSAPSANPFMSAATQQMAPKTNSTNPFL